VFEPLIWMFKVKDFKKHFIFLLFIGLIFLGIALLVPFIALLIKEENNLYYNLILHLVQIILLFIPALCFTGYFWSLTDSIINRDNDIIASNIYNGRIKTIKKISLPELKFFTFIWRGIASIFATILFCLPCYLIYTKIISNMQKISDFWQWGSNVPNLFMMILIVFISTFIPALLWNYARRNSVTAVLNIPKAVYIMGNYTKKYIVNTFLFILLSVIYAVILNEVVTLTGAGITFSISTNGVLRYSVSGDNIILSFVIFNVVNYIISIYWLFVNAFLLGTIAPPTEA